MHRRIRCCEHVVLDLGQNRIQRPSLQTKVSGDKEPTPDGPSQAETDGAHGAETTAKTKALGACCAKIRVRFSTDAPESAQIPVTAMDSGERMGHATAQVLPSLAAGADDPAAAVTQ
jgi:hypothetical protein